MAVLKNKTNRKNFLVVSKIFLQDTDLTLQERGMLATLHSLPDDWELTVQGLKKILPNGSRAIRTALNGLIKKGYMKRSQIKDSNGQYIHNIIELYERPWLRNVTADNAQTDNAQTDSSGQYNNKEYSNKKYEDDRSIDEEVIAQNIHLDWLLDIASQQSDREEQIVNEIFNLICDYIFFPRKVVTIKGVEYPGSEIKKHFMRLRFQHIAGVLNRVIDKNLDICNMEAYLVSALYSASLVETIAAEAQLTDEYLKYLRGEPYHI